MGDGKKKIKIEPVVKVVKHRSQRFDKKNNSSRKSDDGRKGVG